MRLEKRRGRSPGGKGEGRSKDDGENKRKNDGKVSEEDDAGDRAGKHRGRPFWGGAKGNLVLETGPAEEKRENVGGGNDVTIDGSPIYVKKAEGKTVKGGKACCGPHRTRSP